MSNIAQEIFAQAHVHFNGIHTARLQSGKPAHVSEACDNAYITMGKYGDNWSFTIQIRNPQPGDTVLMRWNDTSDNALVTGRFTVEQRGDNLEIIAYITSDHFIGDVGYCRLHDTYGYKPSGGSYYIGGERSDIEAFENAF